MKAVLILVTVWLSCHLLQAQDSKIIKVSGTEDVAKSVPISQQYQYPEFKQGKIAYLTGNLSVAPLNYNLLLGEMQFIDQKGDTLSLANEYTIKHIAIQPDTFLYNPKNGYLQVIANYHLVKLAVTQKLKILGSEKISAYGQATATSAIREYKLYSDANGQMRKLQPKGNVLLAKDESFFLIGGHNNLFYAANKANLLSIFKSRKNDVVRFIKENDINFQKETDLRKLLQFCQQLP